MNRYSELGRLYWEQESGGSKDWRNNLSEDEKILVCQWDRYKTQATKYFKSKIVEYNIGDAEILDSVSYKIWCDYVCNSVSEAFFNPDKPEKRDEKKVLKSLIEYIKKINELQCIQKR